VVPADVLTTSSTSSDLLTLVRRHDPAGWKRFIALYGPMVYEWCRRRRLEPADAGDVTQEVFTAVFKSIDRFRHERRGDTLRGWLAVICRNKTNDLLRRRLESPHAAEGGTSAREILEQLAEDTDDETIVVSERHALVRDAASLVRGEFENPTWQAFWLVAVEGYTTADAAAKLNMTPGAVRQAKYIVLRRLREELSGEFD
jgi:RNA polymerase sigma-70 factor, ECF subfamily